MAKTGVRSPLWTVLSIVFLDLLGFGILIPVIPLLLADPHSPYFLLENITQIDRGYILLGLLTAIYPFTQFIATPILGQLSDRYGRKPILVASLIGTMLSYVLFALAILTRNIPLLFISRALDGITGGNISVAQASLADVTTPEHRARTFGLIGAAFGLGFIIGPFLGGKLSDPHVLSWFDATTPFWFAALLSFFNVLQVILRYQETNQHRRQTPIRLAQSAHNILTAFSHPRLRTLFLTLFFYVGGFAFFTSFASIFFIERFHFNQGNIGDLYAYLGIWIVIAQGLVVRQVAKRYSEPTVLRFSLFGTSLFMLLTLFVHNWPWLLVTMPLFAMSNGLTMANATALVSKSADAQVQGEILGLNSSVQSFSSSLPPMLSGFVAAKLNPVAPIYVSVGIILLGGLSFLFLYRNTASSVVEPVHHDS